MVEEGDGPPSSQPPRRLDSRAFGAQLLWPANVKFWLRPWRVLAARRLSDIYAFPDVFGCHCCHLCFQL